MIASDDKASDDVSIGELRLDDRPKGEVLGEARVQVTVTDGTSRERSPAA